VTGNLPQANQLLWITRAASVQFAAVAPFKFRVITTHIYGSTPDGCAWVDGYQLDDERREVLEYARRIGMSDFAISTRLRCSVATVRNIAGAETPPARQPAKRVHDADVRELWSRGLSDRAIAARLGLFASNVYRIRVRLRLPANYTTTGQPIHRLEAA
jgi:hypothetical protein